VTAIQPSTCSLAKSVMSQRRWSRVSVPFATSADTAAFTRRVSGDPFWSRTPASAPYR
jgi:hypothetical protein